MDGSPPPWLQLSYRKVISSFLAPLSRSHGWKCLHIVSPWISDFDEAAGMSFNQVLNRIVHDDTTVYLVTRPPTQEWHEEAVEKMARTGKANIVLVEDLHTKLYCARTDQGEFALIGSANMTAKALDNREIGVLIRATGPGKVVVQDLLQEAAQIYRCTHRVIKCARTAWRS